ncbi:hypothetical protein ABIF79_009950 [Bradyrhizobium japonicum]
MGLGILKFGMVEHLGVAPAVQKPLKMKVRLVNKGSTTPKGGESHSLRRSKSRKKPLVPEQRNDSGDPKSHWVRFCCQRSAVIQTLHPLAYAAISLGNSCIDIFD